MKDRSIPTVYLRFRKRVPIAKGKAIYLGQIVDLISEQAIEIELGKLVLCKPNSLDGNLILIDIIHVVRKIKERYPDILIEQYGEPHTLVEIISPSKHPHILLVCLVWLLLFIGSGLTIMNFHTDVSMLAVHKRIYELLTGKVVEHPYFLQIPYSLGIGIGMVLFFNHLFKKKFNEEPSPLDVEMFLYQENMNKYVITEEYGKIQQTHERNSYEDSSS